MDVMEHTDNLYSSISRYFHVLEEAGYYKKEGVRGLLIYLFITEAVFNGQLSEHLDDAGLSAFNRALNCLYNNGCIIGRITHFRFSKPRDGSYFHNLRQSQQYRQRSSADNPRKKEDGSLHRGDTIFDVV